MEPWSHVWSQYFNIFDCSPRFNEFYISQTRADKLQLGLLFETSFLARLFQTSANQRGVYIDANAADRYFEGGKNFSRVGIEVFIHDCSRAQYSLKSW